MKKEDYVLMALAPAKGGLYTPVQVQKLFFVLDEEIPERVNGPHFSFEPYDYGPFDAGVYSILEKLHEEGLVDIARAQWNSYRLTSSGQQKGDNLLEELPIPLRDYVLSLSEFVRSCSFSQLVSTIYKAYPRMRVNSIFQG